MKHTPKLPSRVAALCLAMICTLVPLALSSCSGQDAIAAANGSDPSGPPPVPPSALLTPPDGREYDLVVRNARIMDPESGLDGIGEIGIIGDRIAALSTGPLKAKAEVDAQGAVAAPGFIDTCVPIMPQTSSMRYIEWWKLTDGVSTTIWMHDGIPSYDYGTKSLPQDGHYTDWAFGYRITSIDGDYKTLAQKYAAADSFLAKGGVSIGGSPEYSNWITTDQYVEYAKIAKKHGVPFVIHTRYAFKDTELAGVKEAIEIAERSGARVHIFHLPSTGGTWHMAEALALIEEARSRGIQIDASVYMYSYWMTFINAAARMGSGWQEGLGLSYSDMYYVPWKSTLTKDSWAKAQKAGGLVVVPEGTIDWNTSIMTALAKDWVFISSDGSYDVKPDGRQVVSHPRDTGAFAQSLAEARDRGIPLMTALRKMTLDPARFLESSDPSFADRGRIRVGAYANVTIFDPATVKGMGTILEPAKVSAGIKTVVINGRVAYSNGEVLGTYGRLLCSKRAPK